MPAAEELDLAVRGHRLHGQRFGSPDASLVLAVHGLSGTMRTFDHLGERLGGDAIQVVALDLRGRGRSDASGPGTYGWENHALDLFAVADALGAERLGVVGHSMGGSVAMKAAELDGSRLDAVVLLDVAGRVDRGVGPVIASVIAGVGPAHPSYDAIVEDRAYTATQDPYRRWQHLTMPSLLVRATRELAPGAGFVVPAADRDRFEREVPRGRVVEVDADHRTITTAPAAADAIERFFRETAG